MTPRPAVGIMIICLLGIFASAEVSSVEDDQDTPPESLLAKSVPTEEMVTGAPAAAPPPPDPAALAMAMAMKEKAEKGKEKTTKKMRESARKSKKRAVWRARQAAKLKKIRNEANAKIKKEAMHKKKLSDFQHKKEKEEKAKKKKIKAKVNMLKKASMVKIAKMRARNKLTKKRMNAKMALLKKNSKEKNTKLTVKVKGEIGLKQKKAAAKRTLVLAKLTSETAKKKAAANKALAVGEKAIQDHYAKIALDDQKEAQTKTTFKRLLAAKTANLKKVLAERNQQAAHNRAIRVAKEKQKKSRIQALFNKKIALARAGHVPGGARVLRVAQRKKKLVRLLKRVATRHVRAQVLASKKKFGKMMRKSQKALSQVARAELHVMRKASKGDDKTSNMAVTDAWSLAMGRKPTKPQAEALRLVKQERDTPSTDLLAAWKMAVGKHLPNAPTGPKPARRTVQAFAEALDVDTQSESARQSLRVAWEAAVGHAPRGTAAAVAQALQFTPGSTAAPPPQVGSSRAVAPSDEVIASLAAGAAAKVIPGGAPVLGSAGAPVLGSAGAWDADPEDAANTAMESVLVKAHEIVKPMVTESVKRKASHTTKGVQPSVAVETKATKATRTKDADTKNVLHIKPAGAAKKHVPKAKRSAAIMAKLKELEGVRALLKKKRAHNAAATVVVAATSLDLEAVKAAPSSKKKPSDLVEEGAGAGASKPVHSAKHSGVAATKCFGVTVALVAAGAMLCQ